MKEGQTLSLRAKASRHGLARRGGPGIGSTSTNRKDVTAVKFTTRRRRFLLGAVLTALWAVAIGLAVAPSGAAQAAPRPYSLVDPGTLGGPQSFMNLPVSRSRAGARCSERPTPPSPTTTTPTSTRSSSGSPTRSPRTHSRT
jgi:hypothetical protein